VAEPAENPEDRLEQLVDAIAAKGDFPAAARVIQRLHDAVRRENCNALEVARVILDDPGLSSKVLRIVNSSFYRPRGEPVSTITRAVFLLGFQAIGDLATGLVLLDEVARAAGGRAAIRDLLYQCLVCGSVARAMSAVVGYPNPEEAYLLGLFANWGRLCLAAYYPERYERALRSAEARVAIEHALGAEFGLGSDDLATAMLARWNFTTS
jgi:HD-like signal output (HDOD) protein